jgi:Tol biopolymer transport system component
MDTAGSIRNLTKEASAEVVPSWSRDGHWVYFASDRTGDWQVWKIAGTGGTAVQVTRHGGFAALESLDGNFCTTLNTLLFLEYGGYP